MSEIVVEIPKEHFSILDFKQDGLPGVGVINTALRAFQGREVFAWHLSVILDLEAKLENGMPAQAERDLIDPFGDALDVELKIDPEHPNALFLARITWNATRELIWRVYDPEVANATLKDIVDNNRTPRPLEYRMQHDLDWQQAAWHLAMHKPRQKKPKS